MTITSVVVEIKNGSSESVLGRLARIPQISVYGIKDNQIVTVVESGAAHGVEDILKEVQLIEEVTGVYPVFVGDEEKDS